MDAIAGLLLLGVLFCDTASHLFLKAASVRAADSEGLDYWRKLLALPGLWAGIATWVVLFFLWLGFLSRVPLGQGVMAGSITIAGVMIGGRLLFGERITRKRAAAIGLIAVGVALVGWGHE